jgi:DNA-directed RNA polymerase subunit beta'
LGEEAAQLYLLTEVQKVYRSQGVNIADKHFEIMIRKMLSKVQITRSGNTKLLPGELIDKLQLLHINTQTMEQGGEPAAGRTHFVGSDQSGIEYRQFPVRF